MCSKSHTNASEMKYLSNEDTLIYSDMSKTTSKSRTNAPKMKYLSINDTLIYSDISKPMVNLT